MKKNNNYKHFQDLGFMQLYIEHNNPQKNLIKIEDELKKKSPAPGTLILLPELWAGGFSYDNLDEMAQQALKIYTTLERLANQYSIVIGGSVVENNVLNGECVFYNTMRFAGAEVFGEYRKEHLFEPIDEKKYFTEGGGGQPISTPCGNVGAMICYDIRFPESARNMVSQGADVLAVAAQWPDIRIEHWITLLRARSIENQIYTVACNGLGSCLDVKLGGRSIVIDPLGKIVLDGKKKEGLFIVPIDKNLGREVRKKFSTLPPKVLSH